MVSSDVGRREEQHVGQVEVDLEVVVAERVVLRRVEHLEQRRRRVAAVVGADLVDLVEQHDRVHRARLADRADDAAGQRADVGAPVAADLGLVAHAAEGDADELAAQRPGDRLAQRRLADAGRADQRQHRAGAPAADLLQAAAAAPRDRTARNSISRSLTSSRPAWSASSTARAATRSSASSVRSFHGMSRTVSSQVRIQPASGLWSEAALQLVDLVERGLQHVLGQVGRLDAGAVVVGALRLAFAQLLADRGELLAQQELALLSSPCPRGRPCRSSREISCSATCSFVQPIEQLEPLGTSVSASSWAFCASSK